MKYKKFILPLTCIPIKLLYIYIYIYILCVCVCVCVSSVEIDNIIITLFIKLELAYQVNLEPN